MARNGYVHRIQAAVESGLIPRGEVTQVEVEHRAGCGQMSDGRCDCSPLLTVLTAGQVIRIAEDGTASDPEAVQ